MDTILIHVNPAIDWQNRYAEALKKGFALLGKEATVTHNPKDKGFFNILLGPNWAADYHFFGLMLDRAYWGDPNAVAVHWYRNGQKVFHWHGRAGRYHPELKPLKTGKRSVLFQDYKTHFKPAFTVDTVRFHPSEYPSKETLSECLERHEVAYGGKSTVLVDAAINGLFVKSLVENSPVEIISGFLIPDRVNWIKSLSWHNWTIDEIARGELWNYFYHGFIKSL